MVTFRHQLQAIDQKLLELHNDYHGYVTSELHAGDLGSLGL